MPTSPHDCRCSELAARIDKLEQGVRDLATAGALNARAGLVIMQVLKDNGIGEPTVTH